jgi:hypothetical protein
MPRAGRRVFCALWGGFYLIRGDGKFALQTFDNGIDKRIVD